MENRKVDNSMLDKRSKISTRKLNLYYGENHALKAIDMDIRANADDCIDVLMLAKHLEKIGDHAVNVAEWEIFQETGNMRDTRLL